MHLSRRTFLAKSLATVCLILEVDRLPVNAGLLGSLFGKAGKKTLPFTPNDDFYVTSIDATPTVDLERWTLSIEGLTQHSRIWTYDELLKRSRTSIVATLECIGNPLGGEQIGTAKWTGIPLHELLDEVGVSEDAIDLVLYGADGYSDSFSISRAREKDVLLALMMNDVPLPPDHGFPVRMIVPGLYGIKNVKWLKKLELVDHDYRGYWQREGWPEDATIKPQSRIDLPGDRETVTKPKYLVQGMAFGGQSGVANVEVSMDLGVTWQPVTLAPPLSRHAWRLWTYEWQIPQPGEYTLMVRAINGQGVTQGKRLGDWHAISVEAKL